MRIFPRYRRPSARTLLGLTKAKRRVKKAVGIAAVEQILNTPTNLERIAKRRMGYYSEPMKLFRFLRRVFR